MSMNQRLNAQTQEYVFELKIVLEVKNLRHVDATKNISFSVKYGSDDAHKWEEKTNFTSQHHDVSQ